MENGFEEEQDDWFGAEIQLNGTPEQLWSDHPIDATPASSPELWIEDLAGKTEVKRLVEMGVLVPAAQLDKPVTGKLTTKNCA